jgi:alpha-N-arabinofuranosidase
LPAGKFTGRTTFALRIPPGYNLVCDMLSLMPSDNYGTIRREALEAMRQVPAGIIRFPGGCFASTYRWRDGIGDRDTRPVDFHNWWHIPLLNDFGTVEFLTLCKAIGAEAVICVPVMFDDAYNAADWVAFCNTAHHSLHAKAGIKRSPMPVKYWELDNETMRTMDAITYAHRCVEFSRAMKQVDPRIKTIMNCYHVYSGALREMLEIAGGDIDLVNGRDGTIAAHRRDLATLAQYNAAHKREVGLCRTEFRANHYELPTEPGGPNFSQLIGKDSRTAKTSRWAYGLTTLCDYLDFQSFGGDFQFADFTGYNDGWGEGLIYCAKSRVYLSAVGQAFAFLQRQRMAWPLAIETATSAPLQRVQVAWDPERKTLILFALNLSHRTEKLTFNLSGIDTPLAGTARVESLAASPTATVPEIGPNPVVRESATLTTEGKTVAVELRPYSATAITLERQVTRPHDASTRSAGKPKLASVVWPL